MTKCLTLIGQSQKIPNIRLYVHSDYIFPQEVANSCTLSYRQILINFNVREYVESQQGENNNGSMEIFINLSSTEINYFTFIIIIISCMK